MLPAADLFKTYEQAQGMLAAGNLRQAADMCKQLLDAAPEFPYGYHLMASLFRATGTYEKALTFAQMAIDKAPQIGVFHIHQGQVLVAMGEWKQAAEVFKKASKLEPDNPLALLLWADACSQMKQYDKALSLFARARGMADMPEIDEHEALCLLEMGNIATAEKKIDRVVERKPDYFWGYIHKGKLLFRRNAVSEAEACFAKALKLNPNAHEALHFMGLIQERQGQLDIAISYVMQAVQVRPQHWTSHALLGHLLLERNRLPEAEQALQNAYAIHAHIHIMHLLMVALNRQGKKAAALQMVNQMIAMRPNDPSLQYFRAMFSGETLETAPKQYVSGIFDEYADRFDHHLQNILSYQTPTLLAETICALPAMAGRTGLSLLDLGCGTGLGAQALRDVTSLRVGVDLSEKMLDKARVKELYAELHAQDIVEFMQRSRLRYDLVIATDVLVYVGNLEPFIKAARSVMNPDGLLAFSIEKGGDEQPFRLNATGRYCHSARYIKALAKDEGYSLQKEEDAVVRTENYQPVQGTLFIFKKMQPH